MAKINKKKPVSRIYKVTPKAGVNADFDFMLVSAPNKKIARGVAANSSRILDRDLEAKRYKAKFNHVIAKSPKGAQSSDQTVSTIHA